MDELMRAWWREGRLYLIRDEVGTVPAELSQGPFAELILAALALPTDMQQNIYIELEGEDSMGRFTWPTILELSRDPEFPVII